MADELLGRSVLAMDVDGSEAIASVAQLQQSVSRAEADIASKVGRMASTMAGMGDGAAASANAMDASSKRFVASLEREANRLSMTRGDYRRWQAEAQGIAKDVYEPLARKIDIATKSLDGLGHASRDARVSANQLRAAYQQLPAQITDVFTSLAGGQNPLLVLLQQGGQVKDAFGGIGNAIRGVGSIIKPATLAFGGMAAAIAAVAFGYKKGAEESDEFVRAIVLTGNAVGLTAGQLQDMSKAVAAVGGTQGKAAEVLAAFASSAKVGAAELVKVSQAAIGLERVGGPAIEKTAAQFEALAKSPAQASAELNKQTNFLTAAIYEQIKALEDQGRVSEAAAVAQSRFADVLASRKGELEANMGSIERGWLAIKDAVSGAGDALLGIGRVDTTNSQIKALQNRISATRAGNFDRSELPALQAQLELLQRAAFREAERAGLVKIKNEAEQAGIALLQKQDSLLEKEARKTREIAEIRILANKSRLGDGPGFSAEKEAALIEAVNKKYTEKAKKGEDLNKIYGSLIASSAEHVAALALEAAGTDKLTQGEKRLLDMQSKIAAGTLTYNQALYAQSAAQFQQEAAAERAAKTALEIAKAREQALRHSERLNAQEERTNDSLEKSALAMIEQADKLRLGEDAFNARTAASLRAQAADAIFDAGQRGGNAALEERARLLQLTAALVVKQPLEQRISGVAERVKSLQDEAEALEVSRLKNISLASAIELVNAARIEEQVFGAEPGSEREDALKREIEIRKKLAGLINDSDVGKRIDDFLDPSKAKSFGDALTAAFDGAGNALVRLTNVFGDYARDQQNLSKLLSDNAASGASPEDKRRREIGLIRKQEEAQIDAYANMAGAAKGFFAEGSKGYKTLEAAETAFRAYQLASDLVKGASAAAVAIANQAQGEPYTAFARMAAMAAAMAALGFAVAGGFNKSSGGAATSTQRQGGAATGRVITPDQAGMFGTVFGNDEARSESIANSIEILEKTARLELDYSRGQLSALEAIRDSMAGVANLIVRSVGGGLTTGKNLGIQTGTLSVNKGDPILGALGIDDSTFTKSVPGLGGVVAKLQSLWGKTKQEIVDSGLAVTGTLADLIAGTGVQQFADVQTTSSSLFGLIKKSNTATQFGAVEDQVAEQFGLIFQSIGDTLIASADVLGRDGSTLEAAIQAFVVDIPRLSLKGLKGDELQEAIAAAIGSVSDTLAETILPGLGEFQKVGEGYYETLIRVASGIEGANYQLELLSIGAVDYTEVIRKQGDVGAEIVRQSIAAAESAGGALSSVGAIVNTLSGTAEELAETYTALVDVRTALIKVGESGESLTVAMLRGAGGLDNLASSLDTYFTEFFSEQEQSAANAGALAGEFAKLGLQMPATHEEFRALADALNDGTEAGAAMFAKVIGLAGAFDEVADAAAEAAEKIIDRWRDVQAGVDSVIEDFLSGQDLEAFRVTRIQNRLGEAGLNFTAEEILGATPDQIRAVFEAVGLDGKEAILDVYGAVVELQEAARESAIKELIEGIASSADELLAAYNEVNPAADTLVEAWKKNTDEIKLITGALNDLKGIKAGTAIEQMVAQLEEVVTKRDRFRDVISGNRDTALDILAGRGNQEGVDALRRREAELWKEFASTKSPELAQAITKTTLDRIRLEGTVAQKALQSRYEAEHKAALAAFEVQQQIVTLEEQLRENQIDALREQIDGYKRLAEAARTLPEFLGGLRAGGLSNLSFTDRLSQQRSLFEESLTSGNDPQGQLTAYLQQAQQLYGGATKTYSDIFTAALAKYEASIKDSAANVDPQLAAAQSQLNALEALVEKAPELQEAVVDTSQAEIDAIDALNSTFTGVEQSLTATIGTLQAALESRLTELNATVAAQEATIKELGAELIAIKNSSAATASNTAALVDANELAGASSDGRLVNGR